MKEAQRDVTAFHKAMRCGIGDRAEPGFRNVELRLRLIREEVEELEVACALPAAPGATNTPFVEAVDARTVRSTRGRADRSSLLADSRRKIRAHSDRS